MMADARIRQMHPKNDQYIEDTFPTICCIARACRAPKE